MIRPEVFQRKPLGVSIKEVLNQVGSEVADIVSPHTVFDQADFLKVAPPSYFFLSEVPEDVRQTSVKCPRKINPQAMALVASHREAKPIRYEKDLQIMFRLVWFGTPSDVSAEVNDGRGPADFKISRGTKDKTVVEMKLASNTALRKNLANQVEIYQKASDAKSAIKVVVYFTHSERQKVLRILKELKIEDKEGIVLIDARDDNKPSASKARAA